MTRRKQIGPTLCEDCGGPPTVRDNYRLTKIRGEWLCENCLVMSSEDDSLDLKESFFRGRSMTGNSIQYASEKVDEPPRLTHGERANMIKIFRKLGIIDEHFVRVPLKADNQ